MGATFQGKLNLPEIATLRSDTLVFGLLLTLGVPKIHASVIKRAECVEGYKPWILKEFPEYEIEPWIENFEYEGAEMSIRDYDEVTWQDHFKFDGEKIITLRPENDYDNLLKRGEWGSNRLKRDLSRWRSRQGK